MNPLYTRLTLISFLAIGLACEKKSFTGDKAALKRKVSVDGPTFKVKPPLDISEGSGSGGSGKGNKPNPNPDGPSGGKGEQLSKNITLDCDADGGATIDVYEDGKKPTDPEENQSKGKSSLTLLGTNEEIDEDGKGKGTPVKSPKSGGKGSGKGDAPDDDQSPKKPPIETPTEKDSRMVTTVEGRFCPQSNQARTKILFLVDFSGSMGKHDPLPDSGVAPTGSDPQIDGSCGRLKAAEKILSQLETHQNVKAAMIPFAGGIITDKIIYMEDLQSFKTKVNAKNFCQYVVEDIEKFGLDPMNPGGIQAQVRGLTNYRAAFQAARTMLNGVYGQKNIYFISDGEPTTGGVSPTITSSAEAGIIAGKSLRDEVDNLILNGLLLGQVPEGRNVLEQVAGSPERVKFAEAANELPAIIENLPAPTMENGSAQASLIVEPYGVKDLGLEYFGKDTARPGKWAWKTQPFILVGTKGKMVENTVVVEATGKNGETFKSNVVIRYWR